MMVGAEAASAEVEAAEGSAALAEAIRAGAELRGVGRRELVGQ
jgi:hypothetical protein